MKKENRDLTLLELSRIGRQAQTEKAKARREKVKKLKAQGMTAPQIAAELDIKVRLVHHDFSILKKEMTQ